MAPGNIKISGILARTPNLCVPGLQGLWCDFAADDGDFLRSFNSKPNLVAFDFHYRDDNILSD